MRRWGSKRVLPTLLTDVVSEAAKRARSDRAMLAWALAFYRRRHGLNEDGLAKWLELSPPQLASLALCARPDAGLPGFDRTVQRIASAMGCHTEHLMQLLGEVR
jgi:hypothetical protein